MAQFCPVDRSGNRGVKGQGTTVQLPAAEGADMIICVDRQYLKVDPGYLVFEKNDEVQQQQDLKIQQWQSQQGQQRQRDQKAVKQQANIPSCMQPQQQLLIAYSSNFL